MWDPRWLVKFRLAKTNEMSVFPQVEVNVNAQEVTVSQGDPSAALPLSFDFASWFPHRSGVALIDGSNYGCGNEEQDLTYKDLETEIHREMNDISGLADVQGKVIGLIVTAEESSYFITTFLRLLYYKAVVYPLDPKLDSTFLLRKLEALAVSAVICSGTLVQRLTRVFEGACYEIRLHEIKSVGNVCGVCRYQVVEQKKKMTDIETSPRVNNQPTYDLGALKRKPSLILTTSGTTSTPKIVPICSESLLYNARCIAKSLRLKPSDINLNCMPLFHIGGIMCSFLATMVSGSTIICAPQFNAQPFLQRLGMDPRPTWYYAVPTIHRGVILMKSNFPYLRENLRLVRSGGAHLSHNDALALSKAFPKATILPTYSMSECMPVCSTPPGWKLQKADSVGQPISPSVRIVDEEGNTLPYGQIGEVVIRGRGVIDCYLNREISKDFYYGSSGEGDKWLRTGDSGEIDRDGFLFLKGRIKEVAKRGGEQISLSEVDEAIELMEQVETAIAFAVPNTFWGEEIAVAVVKVPEGEVKAEDVIRFARSKLQSFQVPAQVAFVSGEDLPKTSTGKYKRSQMATKFGVKAVDYAAMELSKKASKVIQVSKALYGMRFLLALFVVQVHVGVMPNKGWAIIQTFSFSMVGFTLLAGFLLSARTSSAISKGERLEFLVTRLAAGHAIFLIGTILAFPWYFLSYQHDYTKPVVIVSLIWSLLITVTGFHFNFFALMFLIIPDEVGLATYVFLPLTWYQTMYYTCLLFFPFADAVFRKLKGLKLFVVTLFMLLQTSIWGWAFEMIDSRLEVLDFTVVTWIWCFFLGNLMWRIFELTHPHNPMLWTVLTDSISVVFVVILVAIIATDNTFPVVGISEYDFYAKYVVPILNRWPNQPGHMIGRQRTGTVIMAIWIYGLAVGKGLTARILSNRLLIKYLSPVAYEIYLFHIPIAFYYYLIVHSAEYEAWWPLTGAYPVPVAWWELFIVILITILVSLPVNWYVAPRLLPLSLRFWRFFFRFFCCCCKCCCDPGCCLRPPSRV